MKLYINGTGSVSPQETAVGAAFWPSFLPAEGDRRKVVDPDYKQWIDIKQIRRMSRVIKMGVGAAQLGLQEAGVQLPDAIITGTAYGCLDDTGVFIKKMVEQEEQMLTPTAFIQSTHNTVAGQIALLLGCHAYNNTFVHRGHSFESALLDASMILAEGEAKQILVGGLDEITNFSHAILERFGLFRHHVDGEGAAFFVLGTEQGPAAQACLAGVQTVYKPADSVAVLKARDQLLQSAGLAWADVDLLVLGQEGETDAWYAAVGADKPALGFKQACGEYPTASAFAMWLANRVLSLQQAPPELVLQGNLPSKINNILIYNHHLGSHHSLILLTVC